MDEDGYVVAETLTQNTVDDADMLPDLLGQIDAPLRRVTGDGAYDTRSVYTAVGEGYGALEAEEPAYREDCRDRKTGVAKETGYRQQARVEGTFLRYKRILGGRLRAKGFEAQKREAVVGCTVLNKMLALGEAQSSAAAK